METKLISKTYRMTEQDAAMLAALAEESGTLNQSAELRMLVRRECERRGLTVDPDEHEGDDGA